MNIILRQTTVCLGGGMNVFREQLVPHLLPNYVVKIETEIVIDRWRIRSIHIPHHDTKQLVTVIELLSPVNKRPGISNFYERPTVDVWPIRLQDPLPTVSVPLLHPDPPVPLDMQQAFHTAYQRARYDALIDYTCLPEPPLSDEERTWIESLLLSVQT